MILKTNLQRIMNIIFVVLNIFSIILICKGTYISTAAYTVPAVTPANGSALDGKCNSECNRQEMEQLECSCLSTGVLVDNIIPVLNISLSNAWAKDLYTIQSTSSSLNLVFRLVHSIRLYQVKIYLFFCPTWNIPRSGIDANVSIFNAFQYPLAVHSGNYIGTTVLTRNNIDQSCISSSPTLAIISINTAPTMSTDSYIITIRATGTLGGVYIGEVEFNNETASGADSPIFSTETYFSSIVQSINSWLKTVDKPQTSTIMVIRTGMEIPKESTPTIDDLLHTEINPTLHTKVLYYKTSSLYNSVERSSYKLLPSSSISDFKDPSDKQMPFKLEHIMLIGALSFVTFLLLVVIAGGATVFIIRNTFVHKETQHEDRVDRDMISDFKAMTSAPIKDSLINYSQELESTFTSPKKVEDEINQATNETESGKLPGKELNENDNITDTDDGSEESMTNTIVKVNTKSNEYACNSNEDKIFQENRVLNNDTMEASTINEFTAEIENVLTCGPIYDLPQVENLSTPVVTQDNIRIIKTLGVGFFGKVVLAETINLSRKDLKLSNDEDDKSIGIQVAVKLLKQNSSLFVTNSFNKELKVMSRLRHKHVVQVLGVCTGDRPFILMEYMGKGDLHDYLERYDSIHFKDTPSTNLSIGVTILIEISKQIANGMLYLSSKGIVHRDLAARNCLLGDDLTVKISDFGMSRSLYESHYYIMKNKGIVPLRWMAKECFSGKFSTKTDVWAFGVTLWEIFTLAKCIPYEDMTDDEVVSDVTKTVRTLLAKPSSCPDNVYQIMLTCWKETSKERASFEELYDNLSSLTYLAT